MKNIVFTIMIALLCVGCSKDVQFTDEEKKPDVSVTENASNIKVVSATLNGSVNSNAHEEDKLGVTNYGFILSKNTNPTAENGWIIKGSNLKDNHFTVQAKNLAPTTKYHYVSFFYDGSKYYYGKTLSFTTANFNESYLTSDAVAGETDVKLKGYLDYEKIGYFDSFKVAFCLVGKITAYSSNMESVGSSYVYEESLYSLSAGLSHDYYFLIEYTDRSGINHTLKGVSHSFFTNIELGVGTVDLGLSVLWSGVNLGANSPEEFGSFLAWGEVNEKPTYTPSNYLYKGIPIGSVTKSGLSGKNEYYDITGTDYDPAHKVLADGWKIPSTRQLQELIDNCSWKYIMLKSTYGFLVTGRNGNHIFLPAAGQYDEYGHRYISNYAYFWASSGSSTIYSKTEKICNALSISMDMGRLSRTTSQVFDAYYGFNIRPVKNKI